MGGPHAPYRQSQRMDIYRDVADKLLAAGHAYHCYCTTEELEVRRDAARAAGRPSGYDGHCRDLKPEQKAAYEAEGRTSIVRFRMPDEPITFTDLVRGELTFTPENVPDYGIVRANGAPLYTLVNPVDDALMEITHVLRGEDLLSSTPRQIALYQALMGLGVAHFVPQFGHLPYVMGEGNKKLSKRDPQASLNLYRERGFLPDGLLNYLSLLGWSFSADQDVFSLDGDGRRLRDHRRQRQPGALRPEEGRGDQRRPHPAAGREDVHRGLRALAAGPVRQLGARELRPGGLRGDRPVRADPRDGALRHHRQRRLPLPRRAGRGRGVLGEGDEGRPGRAAHDGPREAGGRGLVERRVPEERGPRGRRGARPQARQGPGPGPRGGHRPHGRACRSSSPWKSWARSARCARIDAALAKLAV